mmetsp:Transcript_36377/g.46326  ORF Transcript_36377/g.46326 Transcript_36377/m.46326 type:complete len:148 (+) Transcript_36377:62-505(+)
MIRFLLLLMVLNPFNISILGPCSAKESIQDKESLMPQTESTFSLSLLEKLKEEQNNLGAEQTNIFEEMTQKLENLHKQSKAMEDEMKEITKKLVVGVEKEGQVLGQPFLWHDRYVATDNAILGVAIGALAASSLGFLVAFRQFQAAK